ncbi:MAG: hypothetical protein ACI9U2_003499 [Bradymonadia bacterium]
MNDDAPQPSTQAPAPPNGGESGSDLKASTGSPVHRLLHIGPRGIKGLFGWTFFDPANLVAAPLLLTSALLVVFAMRARGAPDWGMAIGLYVCIAVFLRGYFFNYYHGSAFGRVLVLLMLAGGLGGSSVLWSARAPAFRALRPQGVLNVDYAIGFEIAAVLHLVIGATVVIHFLLPRRWLIKATDEIADRHGRDAAKDAPLETIDDPEARAAREAEIATKTDSVLKRGQRKKKAS